MSILVILSAVSACGLALDNEQLVARAKQAETEGDLRAAVIDLRTVLQNEPDNIEARLLLGRIALKTGDAFEAEKSLRRAVELGVPTSEVIEDLGLAMLGQRAYQAVLNEIHPNLVEDEDGRRVVLRIRGEAELGLAGGSESAAERRSHVDAAQVLFRQVLESDPTDAKARMGLAVSYLTEGRKDEARAEIDQAIDGDPEYVRAYIARGKLDLEAGKVDEAVKDFAKAEELARAQYDVGLTATAIAGLADAHFARNDLTSVKASSERLNAVAPDSVPARYLAARVAIADGDYASAGDHLQQILRVAPDWGPALLLYGSVNLYEGNYQQAEAYFSSVLRSDPQNVRAQRGLAEARYLQDNAEGALQALGPSLGAEDVNSDLLAAGGQLSLRAGDIDAGVELLERAAANDPNNLQRRMDLAVGYITAGDIDRAIQILEEMPEDEESDYRRGVLMVLAMQQRGEIETAQSRLDAMINDYPDS
ncbi:MAG: tetratricopeptide repeat protein, partial [Chromatiales bacterium]